MVQTGGGKGEEAGRRRTRTKAMAPRSQAAQAVPTRVTFALTNLATRALGLALSASLGTPSCTLAHIGGHPDGTRGRVASRVFFCSRADLHLVPPSLAAVEYDGGHLSPVIWSRTRLGIKWNEAHPRKTRRHPLSSILSIYLLQRIKSSQVVFNRHGIPFSSLVIQSHTLQTSNNPIAHLKVDDNVCVPEAFVRADLS